MYIKSQGLYKNILYQTVIHSTNSMQSDTPILPFPKEAFFPPTKGICPSRIIRIVTWQKAFVKYQVNKLSTSFALKLHIKLHTILTYFPSYRTQFIQFVPHFFHTICLSIISKQHINTSLYATHKYCSFLVSL